MNGSRTGLDADDFAELVRLGDMPMMILRDAAYDYVPASKARMTKGDYTRGYLIAKLFDVHLKKKAGVIDPRQEP